jgi:hypothetical protein
VSSVLVVVANVVSHKPSQMPFVKDDHVVEKISSAVADPALCDTILPWTSEAGSLGRARTRIARMTNKLTRS